MESITKLQMVFLGLIIPFLVRLLWLRSRQQLITVKHLNNRYTVVDGKLLYKGRLVIPRSLKHIPVLLTENHDSLAGGHSGVFKTLKRIQEGFHWTQMVKDV